MYEYVSEKYKDLTLNINKYFNSSSTTLFNKRNVIKVVEYEDKKYAVKSFKIPNIVNKIVYKYFRESKAKRSYLNSIKLENLNIHTPKPVSYIEFGNVLFSNSYYICEFFDYDFEIRDLLNDVSFENREEIFKKFVAFTYDLHNKGVYHVDYSPGNVIIKKEEEYIFSLIDVNRMKFLDMDLDLRMKSMGKLTSDSNDISFISQEYSVLSGKSYEEVFRLLSFYVNKHQEYIQNKKRIKKLNF